MFCLISVVIDDCRNGILSLVLSFITGAKAEDTFEDDAFIKSTEAIEIKRSDTEPVC